MTKQWPRIPKGLLSPDRDGLADPNRVTAEERRLYSLERLQAEHRRRTQGGPVAALQRAADKALGRTKGRG